MEWEEGTLISNLLEPVELLERRDETYESMSRMLVIKNFKLMYSHGKQKGWRSLFST